jgi:8-oxo-dGTP diphosphatase
MNPIRNSAKAVIVRDGQLLVIRNVDADGDWYLLPGGGQHPGEPLREALQRECLEETGAHVEVGDLVLVREYIGRHHEFAAEDGDTHQVELMFECRIDPSYTPATGAVPDTYQTGVAWLRLSELDRYRIYPSVLRGLLRDGVQGIPCVYLGDVN